MKIKIEDEGYIDDHAYDVYNDDGSHYYTTYSAIIDMPMIHDGIELTIYNYRYNYYLSLNSGEQVLMIDTNINYLNVEIIQNTIIDIKDELFDAYMTDRKANLSNELKLKLLALIIMTQNHQSLEYTEPKTGEIKAKEKKFIDLDADIPF